VYLNSSCCVAVAGRAFTFTFFLWAAFLIGIASGCGSVFSLGGAASEFSQKHKQVGRHLLVGDATWYGKVHQGRMTASGAPFNMFNFTAAHKTLPLGTIVKVTNLKNWRTAVVQITDRGPYGPGRVIDMAMRAGEQLGMIRDGEVPVKITVLGREPIVDARKKYRILAVQTGPAYLAELKKE
jgi:rare lipoprotein A